MTNSFNNVPGLGLSGSQRMKIILWCVFLLVALLWTGAAALLGEAIQWSVRNLATGSSMSLDAITSNVIIPVWLSPWLEPSGWATILQSVQSVIDSAASAVPALGFVISWLEPVVWLAWGIGLLVMFALTIAGTLMLNRFRRSRQRVPYGA